MTLRSLQKSPVTIAVALTMACVVSPTLAHATQTATAKDHPAAAAKALDRDLLRLSDEGRQAMMAVHEARMALFNGNPRLASDALTTAKASLQVTKVDTPYDLVDVRTSIDGKVVAEDVSAKRMDLVPIDGRFILDERLVQDPAKKAHVAKADEHMAQGRSKDAASELRLAEVDASFSRVLMPLHETRKQVNEAARLVDQKKYYDANLALKKAERGLQFDTVIVSEAPRATATAQTK